MTSYILRRLITAVLILLGASFIVYLMTAASGDPLWDLYGNPNAQQLIPARVEALNLDTPPVLRYFTWLGGAAGCLVPFADTCSLGVSREGQEVTSLLSFAMGQTIMLVTVGTILAIVVGITLGIVSALRQYSGLDYGITFLTFLCFSLPSFWLAVLLKEVVAIQFNDFLQNPAMSMGSILLISLVLGVIWYLVSFGRPRTRILMGVLGFVVTFGVVYFVLATNWLNHPFLGIPLIALTGILVAVIATVLMAGLRNRRALYAALGTVLVGLVLYFPVQSLFKGAGVWTVLGLTVVMVLVGAGIGYFAGGYDRGQGARVAGVTGFFVALLLVLDRFMQSWPSYVNSGHIRGRPIATANSATPGLTGDFWTMGLDRFTHLLLPTICLTLLALASYSRYSRASMLEIMGQDYVRTARAKGLSERTVVMRHAFRNALIPLATLVAYDIGGLIGGAIITESVFAFTGMGQLFVQSVRNVDPNPVMGVFLVTGIVAMVFNLVADLVYSVLDPRVRVKA
ncbi:MAG: ABC transporter permease subunit [Kocuria sp.]|uniref:ABC transporter permease subunit n=1 Tax=Kocuria salsicia TaxID=664639 RepID=A0ABV3KCQ7_9MICC|nr:MULTISPECIES: ABC transporter permease subunit [Kocuria]MBS6029754.1 ABC transporter permease subunit [Kocuria rhizophila]MDN5631421.1 ABC transporter permease subunit [Kocuria sp.]MDO4256128.1 ABC transporter permease subunit [Kocuria sp.]RUP81171.1 ABC transporter permease subunit [Kocuria sp. HSID17590]RUQ04840.1 ABC transporter permease subunit [Kocuria sp. HSID17582]